MTSKNQSNDRRSKRTKKLLKQAFMTLLKQKELNQISITSLCDKADINRTTFYLHYEDIYGLLEDIENDFLTQCDEFIDAMIAKNNPGLDITKAVLEYIYKHKELLKLFLIKRNDSYFYHRIDHKVKQLFSATCKQTYEITMSEHEFHKILNFFTYGYYGIYYDWLKEDCKEDINKIADLTTKLSTAYFDATLKRKR